MMRKGHESASAPVVVGTVWGGLTIGLPLVVTGIMGALVWWTCMWPDYDHPRKRGFVAWVVRTVAWQIWLATKTAKDRPKQWGDAHRDATHCIEGAAVFGGLAGGVTAPLLLLADYPSALSYLAVIGAYSPCWAAGVFLGCLSHIGADSMTPSGVPVSVILNRVLGYGTWQRWCLGWRWVQVSTARWLRWLKVPALSVLRISGPRKECEHRGLFKTDSAGEKLLARPLLVAAALVMIAVATGVSGPMMAALGDVVFGAQAP